MLEMKRLRTVFVVEDDPDLRALLERALGASCQLRTFALGRGALNALQAFPPDVLIADLEVPEVVGEVLAWVAGRVAPRPRVVLMSGNPRRLAAAAHLADATLPKPFSLDAIREVVDETDPDASA
jgi:DNA-binding response OmpR family regulator